MKDYVLIAQNLEWGQITRDFKKAISDFTTIAANETVTMRTQVENYSIQGSGGLPSEIRKTFLEKISVIEQSTAALENLMVQLEEKATNYDSVVDQLMSSLDD